MAIPAFRIGAFVCLAVYILLGPLLRQGWGVDNRYLAKWRMYRNKGMNLVDARFYTESPDGEIQRVYRADLPKFVRKPKARPIRRRAGLASATRKMCRSRQVAGGPLYVDARQVRRDGWRELDDGTVDRCREPRSRRVKIERRR
ncbi:MAG: hypothetical protein B7733_13845 [Myxococcales bacterium FL481]|nr:MAG: hypothetical protein B7733_13845 [Myxococcales bacterium FL481]